MNLVKTAALLAIVLATPGAIAAETAATPVVIAPPPPGKGQVVFFRPSAMGLAIRCTIRENGKMIGRVGNGKYFVMVAEPGAHQYTTKTEATDTINIEVEPDETQYLKCKIAAGIMAGRPNLSPSSQAEFDGRSAKLKLQDAEDMAKAIAEDEAEMAAAPPK